MAASWFDDTAGASPGEAPPDPSGLIQGTGDDRLSYDDARAAIQHALAVYDGPSAATPERVNAFLNQLGVHSGAQFSARYLQGIFQNLYQNAVTRQAAHAAAPAATTTPPATTTGGGSGGGSTRGDVHTDHGTLSGADADRIDAMLKNAQSTDDPNYWYGIAAQNGGVENTGVEWLTGRINQGDGALGVRNGTVSKFQDGGSHDATGPQQTFSYAPFTDTFTNPNFVAPSGVDELNDPGVGARLQMGADALQHSAAAKGTLLSGQTLNDLQDYAQNFASTEYSYVYNRALQGYGLNSQNNFQQYTQKYQQYLNNANQAMQTAGFNNAAAQQNWANVFNQSAQNFGFNQQNWQNLYNATSLGLSAAEASAGLGANYGNNAGNTITGIGNAGAAGTVGAANGYLGALGALTNYATGALQNHYGGGIYGNGGNGTYYPPNYTNGVG
jgi:hypothetical protein